MICMLKKPLYILTNEYDGVIIIKTKFDYSKKKNIVIKVPYMISEYNKYMFNIR